MIALSAISQFISRVRRSPDPIRPNVEYRAVEPAKGRRFRLDGRDDLCLVASGLGDSSSGGGLFLATQSGIEALDRLSSTGLSVSSGHVVRALRAHSDTQRIELLTYDALGVQRYVRVDGVGDVHDVMQSGDVTIAVCSSNNAVVWIAPDGTLTDRIDLPGAGDAWHVNSLHLFEDRLFATAFGRYSRERQWAEPGISRDEGPIFDLRTQKSVVQGLSSPHHPRHVDGLWYVCNSGRKEVLGIDERSGRIVRRLSCSGFTRGLVFSDDFIIVGVSAERHRPKSTSAHIAIFDRFSTELVERVDLPVQEIYDSALIPSYLVESLRTGFQTNSLRTEEQTQYSLLRSVGVTEPSRLWAVGDALDPRDQAVTITATIPSRVLCDKSFNVEINLHNRGNSFLVSAPPYPVYVSYKWLEADSLICLPDNAIRTRLPRSLSPKATTSVTVSIRPPQQPGIYDLRVTLVQELVAWFDDVDPSNFIEQRIAVESSVVESAIDSQSSK